MRFHGATQPVVAHLPSGAQSASVRHFAPWWVVLLGIALEELEGAKGIGALAELAATGGGEAPASGSVVLALGGGEGIALEAPGTVGVPVLSEVLLWGAPAHPTIIATAIRNRMMVLNLDAESAT